MERGLPEDPGYGHIGQIRNRRDEAIALGLTLENLVGILLVGLPIFALTVQLPGLLRAALVLGACLLGYSATWQVGGLRLSQRLWLQGRSLLALLTLGRRINREQITGRMRTTQGAPSWGRQRTGLAIQSQTPQPPTHQAAQHH